MIKKYLTLLLFGGPASLLNAQTVGLFTHTAASQDGYVLFAPMSSTSTYLIDKCGKQVHTWTSTYKPGLAVYLQPDGSLLRTGNKTTNITFNAGGKGGVIERTDWNSNVLWSYTISDTLQSQHHDICQLPNGNILAIVWELKNTVAATAAGRNPANLGTSVWSEKIVELQPSGINAAVVVWEWHVWDHLIQDYSSGKANFGVVADHPELINLNYTGGMSAASDWLHINSVAYNPALDQIMLSVHNFSEFWIIDHSTNGTQAAGHSGGAHGKGGDLLYRWGNPAAYNRGTSTSRFFYTQHNAHWIENGLPGAGKVIVFNNGTGRTGGNFSSADVMTTPVDGSGSYASNGALAYAPAALDWQYKAPNPTDFYANNIGGAQRLSNGNTLICNGPSGEFFEIDSNKNIVWQYVNPISLNGPIIQGTTPSMNSSFRCTLYEPSYAGLLGKTLTPGMPLELNPLAYNCSASHTAAVSEVAPGAGFSVANPFKNQLIIASKEEVRDAIVFLTSADGKTCAYWKDITLHSGSTTSMQLPVTMPEGFYVLHIISAKSLVSIKLMAE